ncbi:threonine--tRNA ligase [Striga asiatica]|uniref:Threonine--tRNA ligase n=1 Tax=Striga asiatica TaxID=4170 RepID=A0A5A7PUF2_STRAF|nr:threonine--tRNA ligase [Striga asiatica]
MVEEEFSHEYVTPSAVAQEFSLDLYSGRALIGDGADLVFEVVGGGDELEGAQRILDRDAGVRTEGSPSRRPCGGDGGEHHGRSRPAMRRRLRHHHCEKPHIPSSPRHGQIPAFLPLFSSGKKIPSNRSLPIQIREPKK